MSDQKITIEIWSDIMCPFCYIGKRRLEQALEKFDHRKMVSIQWKSYQLAPDLVTNTEMSSHEHLALHKGISVEEAKSMSDQISTMAKADGLEYHLDKSVVANSFNSHRLSHFAKVHNKQNELEELLFQAHFTDGKNIDDIDTLVGMAESLGLDAEAARKVLESDEYSDDVRRDIAEAQQIGVQGVPFFVFNRKYAVSGAQPVEAFTQTLASVLAELEPAAAGGSEATDGDACSPGGGCC